jgi:branched-chain amino acid transport system permease protein
MNIFGTDLRPSLRSGLIAGVVSLLISAMGVAELFGERELIAGLLTLGQVIIMVPASLLAFMAVKKLDSDNSANALAHGFTVGFVASLPLVALIALANAVNLREFFPNVSPASINLLTFGQAPTIGSLVLVVVSSLVGLAFAGLCILPYLYQRPLMMGMLWTFTAGMFSEILANRLREFFGLAFSRLVFSGKALHLTVAIFLFLVIVLINSWWIRRNEQIKERFTALPDERRMGFRRAGTVAAVVGLLLLPLLLGTYLSEVINNVGLFILMGLGLNIVVGFAGLLDLGYVAFYAIGAYSMAVLTTQGPLGLFGLSFWAAIPICVLIAATAGLILGIPVLRMRGDYLAIVTLGFGEIIRLLALSDMMSPLIGGAQGVLKIPKPTIGSISLIQPELFYYVVLGGCLIAVFVSIRLSDSRLGRQWMAMREDEDVAEAMGIRLVTTKLLAFGIGAAFSGLAGALLASKLTSIFPHSFSLAISINVLSLIIIGGIGSLPGVVAGALILVGLPELLREFAEYRLLMYGALLVVMMLAKPEGFIPSAVRRRELRAGEDSFEEASLESASAGD